VDEEQRTCVLIIVVQGIKPELPRAIEFHLSLRPVIARIREIELTTITNHHHGGVPRHQREHTHLWKPFIHPRVPLIAWIHSVVACLSIE
jgi:hypothetical protein